ncbi:EF-hand domain-containing protein [Paraurantiacibacter namhicola]|uniref:EF hand n=1 Tax=Paraurantiacibacter namhicola TaxID=645517 RepID=A0A1C7D9B2_9SPHN|nr:EF-hand domain-containing protein [Paraurantiacibacter namhicola]ANU08038.1 EF hand [Paraurantiacibacter namhicola]
MNRLILGAFLALAAAGIAFSWLQGRQDVERAAPPAVEEPLAEATPEGLPSADAAGMTGPAPPEATELSKEQRRFFRYDRNRDLRISRNEMLSSRTKAFRKLDTDGNNLLTFEEWAVATVDKFDGADADRDGELTQKEFASTKPKPAKRRPGCNC